MTRTILLCLVIVIHYAAYRDAAETSDDRVLNDEIDAKLARLEAKTIINEMRLNESAMKDQ